MAHRGNVDLAARNTAALPRYGPENAVSQEMHVMQHPPGIGMCPVQMHHQIMTDAQYVPYLNPMSMCFDPRWASTRPNESGYNQAGGMMAWTTPSSSNEATMSGHQQTPTYSPCYRYASRCSDGRLSPHQQPTRMRRQPRAAGAGGTWAPYLPKPTAKRAARQLRQEHSHGERVHRVADARRFWTRLYDWYSTGPGDTEDGFSSAVVQYARCGREYIKKALEQTTTRAWQWWRSIRRSPINAGGEENYMFGEYDVAVRQYRERQGRRAGRALR